MHLFQQPITSLKSQCTLALTLALSCSAAIAQQTMAQASGPQSAQVAAKAAAPLPSAILAHGPAGTSVSLADILSELQRAPAADRQAILAKPELVQQIASNLLVRRVLAAEAERDGLGADPVVVASLAIARDHILSAERLA